MKQEEINEPFHTTFDHIFTEINDVARKVAIRHCVDHNPFSFDDDFLSGNFDLE